MVSEINSNPVFVDLHSASIARCPSVRRPDAFRPVHHLIDSDDRLGVYRDPANEELLEHETGMHEVRDGDGSSRARVARLEETYSSGEFDVELAERLLVELRQLLVAHVVRRKRPGQARFRDLYPEIQVELVAHPASVTRAPVSGMLCKRKFT